MRQIGGVLGTAGIAALMQARLNVNLPGASATASTITMSAASPSMRASFGTAMGQALLLPGIVVAVASLSVLFLTPHRTVAPQASPALQVGASIADI
jgi:energy-converting hydrogenase Eha subunit G